MRQFWYQSKHRPVEASSQERARKYHPKKKKKKREEETHAKTHWQRRPTTTEIDPLAAETHRPALHRRRHYLHPQPPLLSALTTINANTQDIMPPLLHN